MPAPPRSMTPVAGPITGTARIPGSKSYTNRALPIAALATGTSRLTGVLDSEDTQVMMTALRQLGAGLTHDPNQQTVDVVGVQGRMVGAQTRLFCANSGTTIRFLTALAAAGQGTFILDGIERMRERPIKDLIDALRGLGIAARCLKQSDCPPVEITSQGLPGGAVTIRGDVSSQFLSGLLLAAPLAQGPLTIRVDGELVSQPYVDMTLATMAAFGVNTERVGYTQFQFAGRQQYRATDYPIEPDASAASYFFGAAAISAGRVTVENLGRGSLQGDLQFVESLRQMGCTVEQNETSTTVIGRPLHGIDVDMCHISDTVPTLAAVACLADGPTRIRNVAHIRRKETDRITAMVTELRRAGVAVDEHADGMTIHPRPIQPAAFQTYNDHRMAMSLALLGLRATGVVILDPQCTAKTFPHYFEELDRLCGR